MDYSSATSRHISIKHKIHLETASESLDISRLDLAIECSCQWPVNAFRGSVCPNLVNWISQVGSANLKIQFRKSGLKAGLSSYLKFQFFKAKVHVKTKTSERVDISRDNSESPRPDSCGMIGCHRDLGVWVSFVPPVGLITSDQDQSCACFAEQTGETTMCNYHPAPDWRVRGATGLIHRVESHLSNDKANNGGSMEKWTYLTESLDLVNEWSVPQMNGCSKTEIKKLKFV